MSNLKHFALVALLLPLAFPAPSTGQAPGSIEGTVLDGSGSPLPGVRVTVTGAGVREERVTGADGAWTASGLAPGDYLVSAVLSGFRTVETRVTFAAGAHSRGPDRHGADLAVRGGERRRRGAPAPSRAMSWPSP